MSHLLLYFLACGPKEPTVTTPTEPVASRTYTEAPQPLEPRPFQIPTLEKGTLSNGIEVVVSHNTEIPKVNIFITFGGGSWSDSNDQFGLAQNTMDMIDEGTSEYNAAALATEQKKLAASIGSSSGLDGSSISLSSLQKNLPQSLDLFAKVVLDPVFPSEDWEKMRKKKIQNVQADKKDPSKIAYQISTYLLYGDYYAGRHMTEALYQNITTEQMKVWYTDHITADQAKIWVGGAVTLEEVLPLLEERFGSWSTKGKTLPKKPSVDNIKQIPSTQIYFHDIAGSQQSVLRLGHFVGNRTDETAPALLLANQSIGGMFTARINMNLREDKGWTYGARSYLSDNYLPSVFVASSSVVTPHTADSVREIVTEIRNAKDSKPITQEELDNGRGYFLGTWPLKFENATYLLNQNIEQERYDLPDDWITGYPERLRSVTLEQAQNSWNSIIDEDNMIIVIVGDLAATKDSLLELGYSIQQVDAQGKPIEE